MGVKMKRAIALLVGLWALPVSVWAGEDMDWSYASGIYARQDYLNRLQDQIAHLPPAQQNAVIAHYQTYMDLNPCRSTFPSPCYQQPVPAPVYYQVQPTYQPAYAAPRTRPCLIPISQISGQPSSYRSPSPPIPQYNFDTVTY